MAKRTRQRSSPNLPVPNPQRAAPKVDLQGYTNDDIAKILLGYLAEARFNRLGGPSPREFEWRQNVDLYWNRFDFSKKADWQAKLVMPEVPMYVDRFAAAMRKALVSSGDFFVVEAPFDDERDVADALHKLMRLWLDRCGRDALGHPLGFEAVFEEQMKLGALMMTCAVVTYKGAGTKKGYVSIDSIDPRTVWLDTSGRNLYRIRRYEIDKQQLMELARLEDAAGNPIYDMDEMERLTAGILLKERWENMQLQGSGRYDTSTRITITLDEYICTLISPDGKLIAENVLCVMANERYLIRGPEKNPYWHESDWVVAAPLVTAPLAPYGRAYMENMARLADAYNQLTNLIVDGTYTTALKAFAADPNALDDPTQLAEGIWPNKIFLLADGMRAQDFMKEIDLGSLPAESIQVWQAIKTELQESAAFSDIGLGQFAPKGRTSASEVTSVQDNSTALMASIANTIEKRLLEPLLTIFWMTGLQHMPARDPAAEQAIGEAMYRMIYKQRKNFVKANITFKVSALSALVERTQKLQKMLNMLQVIAQNQQLMARFMQRYSVDRIIDELFQLYDIDPEDLEPTAREQLIAQITQQSQPQQPQPGASGAPAGPPAALTPTPTPNPIGTATAPSPMVPAQ